MLADLGGASVDRDLASKVAPLSKMLDYHRDPRARDIARLPGRTTINLIGEEHASVASTRLAHSLGKAGSDTAD